VCGSFIEQRLKLFVAFTWASEGKPKPWAECKKEKLNNLIQAAEARPDLQPFATIINRNVRNALAHGTPEIDVNAEECRFHDHDQTVTWKFPEFFERTKLLTIGAIALMYFEAIMKYVQLRNVATVLWKFAHDAPGDGTTPPGAVSTPPSK